MKLSSIHDSFATFSVNSLEKFEREIGAHLPDDYRNFLLKVNGGSIHHPYIDPLSELRLDGFYGFSAPKVDQDIENVYKATREWIPEHLLPIGTDAFGNQLCVCFLGSDRDKLFFCDHEGDSFADELTQEMIANSFEEFVSRMEIENETPDVDLEGASTDVAAAFQAIYEDNAFLLAQPLIKGLNADATDGKGSSLLHYAASGCRLECITVLLENHANLEIEDGGGATPLFKALGCQKCLELLASRGANIEAQLDNGCRLIQYAIEGQFTADVETLLVLGANVHEPTTDGRTIEQLIKDTYSNSYYKLDAELLLETISRLK